MFLIRNKNYLSLVFILLVVLSCTIPSLANKRLKAQTEESVVFFEDFSQIAEPEIGDKLTKEGMNNFWGTVKTGDQNILWSDYLNSPYLSNAANSITSKSIDLSSPYITSSSFNFNVACDTEPRLSSWSDYVSVNFFDGINWIESEKIDETLLGDENYHAVAMDLKNYHNNNFKFKLTWITNGQNNEHLGCSFWPLEIKTTEDLPYLAGSLQIDQKIGQTTDQKNILLHPSSNRGNKMRFSMDSSSWTDWAAYAGDYTFDITDGKYGGNNQDGFKIIFVQFKDIFGSLSESAQASINYSTIKIPGNISNGSSATPVIDSISSLPASNPAQSTKNGSINSNTNSAGTLGNENVSPSENPEEATAADRSNLLRDLPTSASPQITIEKKKFRRKVADAISNAISFLSNFFHEVKQFISNTITNNEQQLNDQGTVNLK